METAFIELAAIAALIGTATLAAPPPPGPGEGTPAERAALAAETRGKGYGPQSPRDIDHHEGNNRQVFSFAPEAAQMTLCNIHLHESAEHKGGEFTRFATDGIATGFVYDGTLTPAERAPLDRIIGAGETGGLMPGDTVEVHFVYSTAHALPGHGLQSCFTEETQNPQLRVEAVIGVLVNDPAAGDFTRIARIEDIDGLNQLPDLPGDLGTPTVYNGSTTGEDYDLKGSPVQVTWSVRPKVAKIGIRSLATWFAENPFGENHAHHVRNLVTDPELLSQIN